MRENAYVARNRLQRNAGRTYHRTIVLRIAIERSTVSAQLCCIRWHRTQRRKCCRLTDNKNNDDAEQKQKNKHHWLSLVFFVCLHHHREPNVWTSISEGFRFSFSSKSKQSINEKQVVLSGFRRLVSPKKNDIGNFMTSYHSNQQNVCKKMLLLWCLQLAAVVGVKFAFIPKHYSFVRCCRSLVESRYAVFCVQTISFSYRETKKTCRHESRGLQSCVSIS